MQDVIERYIGSWNQTDPQRRRHLVDELWAEDASDVDPMAEANGRNEVDAMIAAVQAQFPGFVFTLVGPVDAHHRQARFTWGLGPAGADPVTGWWFAGIRTPRLGHLRPVDLVTSWIRGQAASKETSTFMRFSAPRMPW